MPKPLRSEIRNPPNRQFAHFGVLDTGGQNKSAFFGSIVFNVVLALIAIIIGASVKKTIDQRKKLELTYAEIKPIPKPPEPPKPKIVPPKPLPPKIEPPKIEPPKVEPPKIEPPKIEPPKPVPVPVQPKPTPPAPVLPKVQQVTLAAKLETPANAPKVTNVALPGQSAALKNNNTTTPQAVSMGHPDSAVPKLTGPAVSNINMGAGMQGGAPTTGGVGKPSAVNLAGNGSPGGKIGGTSAVAVVGLPHGTPGGTGTVNSKPVAPVQMGQVQAPPPPTTRVVSVAAGKPPQVLYKPKPVYTADATAAHIEGSITVRIKVSATGAVTVLGVSGSLGHGLDESAKQCAAGIKFKPATDANGNPIDWEGPVTISFQMA